MTGTSCWQSTECPTREPAFWATPFGQLQVGVPLVVTIVPKDLPIAAQRTISLPVTSARFNSWDVASDLVVGFFLPAVSLLLGFWVAFRRPRDPLAWLLLVLMLSFPHILQTFIVQGWAPGWREAGLLYESMLRPLSPSSFSCSAAFSLNLFRAGADTTKRGEPCNGCARSLSLSWLWLELPSPLEG